MGIFHAKDFCEWKHDAGVEKWVSNFDVFQGGRNKEQNKKCNEKPNKEHQTMFFTLHCVKVKDI